MPRHIMLLGLLVACQDGEGTDDTATGTTATGTGTATTEPYEPTWAGMQVLFADHCNRCHPAMNGIDLVEETPHQLTPEETGYLPWVTPGASDQSWMWLLVSGQAGVYTMPNDGLLPLEVVEPMREWIDAGASFE